jgi:hypothetical protein
MTNPQSSTLAEIGKRLGRKALEGRVRGETGHNPWVVPTTHREVLGNDYALLECVLTQQALRGASEYG